MSKRSISDVNNVYDRYASQDRYDSSGNKIPMFVLLNGLLKRNPLYFTETEEAYYTEADQFDAEYSATICLTKTI